MTSSGAENLDEPHEFLHLLRRLLRDIRQEVSDSCGDVIAPSQLRLLRVLHHAGQPLRLGELAQRMDVAARSMTTKVDHAEADGWLRRAADPRDRRATRVELTDAGRNLLTDLSGQRQQGARSRLDLLSSSERAELMRMLRILADAPQHTSPAAAVPSARPNAIGGRS